jgi:hypothetical protein
MVGIVFNHSSSFSFSSGPSMNHKDTMRHHRRICNQVESCIAAWKFDLVGERRNHPTSRFQFQGKFCKHYLQFQNVEKMWKPWTKILIDQKMKWGFIFNFKQMWENI